MPVKTSDSTLWLNYHHLFYFHTIAATGSIAKAAEKLRVGQPALSVQLKQLEESLGRPLFERSNRRLALTEAGKIAFEYTQEVFRLGDEMVQAVHDRLVNNRVQVQIGALDSVPKKVILDLIMKAYSIDNCSVVILEGRGDELFREMFAHHLDLIVSNYPPAAGGQQGVYSRAIAKFEVLVCAAPKFKNLKKGFPESLQGQPMVMPTLHSKLRHDLNHFFRLSDIQVDVVAETQDTSIQTLLGADGVGLIPIAAPVAEDLLREKKLIPLGRLKNVFEEIWLISASRRIENPVAAKLMTAEW